MLYMQIYLHSSKILPARHFQQQCRTSYFFRIGFAGEFSPRNIIRTEYMDEALIVQVHKKGFCQILLKMLDIFCSVISSTESMRQRGPPCPVSSISSSTFTSRKCWSLIFSHLFSFLQSSPHCSSWTSSGHHWISSRSFSYSSCYHCGCTRDARSSFHSIRSFSSHGYLPIQHQHCTRQFITIFSLRLYLSIFFIIQVLDLGWTEACAMPIAEGITMLSQWEAVGKGGKAVTKRLRELLEKVRIMMWYEGRKLFI